MAENKLMKVVSRVFFSLFYVITFFIVTALISACSSDLASAPVSNLWYQKNANNDYYRVHQGDTLYSIAWMFGLDYRSIAAANHLSAPYSLVVGQRLKMTNVPKGDYRATVASRPSVQVGSAQSVSVTKKKWLVSSKPPRHWQWPAKGRIVQRFKPGFATNTGLDISGHYREPVRAAAAGIVVYSGAGVRGYGNLVIVKHSSSYLSAYAYNRNIRVRLGQRVRMGQTIATMGRNMAGKTMLHFEIRKDGRPVDPLLYLRR